MIEVSNDGFLRAAEYIKDGGTFPKQYFEQYKRIYNECFYEMRQALDIKPYHFLCDYAV